MFFRRITVLAVFMVLSSCDFISLGPGSPRDAVSQELSIDYNTVDVYPLFRACNNCDSNENQNLCFERTLVNELEKILKAENIKAGARVSGTVFVDILVNRAGKIIITHINAGPEVRQAIPKLDAIFQKGITRLPEVIRPALKRGIPVDVQFRLPVRIAAR